MNKRCMWIFQKLKVITNSLLDRFKLPGKTTSLPPTEPFWGAAEGDSLPALLTAMSSHTWTCHVCCPHCGLGSHLAPDEGSKLSASRSCFNFKWSRVCCNSEGWYEASVSEKQNPEWKGQRRNSTTELKCFRCVGLFCKTQSCSLVFPPQRRREDEPLCS